MIDDLGDLGWNHFPISLSEIIGQPPLAITTAFQGDTLLRNEM
ncbi:MAG: hypothetical protein ACOY90_16795 [Candidatus Zhuqueibacterota bacterium]